jgi:lysophospholipase L1-like esterase
VTANRRSRGLAFSDHCDSPVYGDIPPEECLALKDVTTHKMPYASYKGNTSMTWRIMIIVSILGCHQHNPEHVDILAMGDSIAEGHPQYHSSAHNGPAGNSDSQIWHHLVADLGGGYSFTNAGYGGETSATAKGRLPSLLKLRTPDYVYLHVGVNDILEGVPLADYVSNLESFYTEVVASGAEMVIGQILPWTAGSDDQQEKVKLWNAELEKWCFDRRVKLAYAYELMLDLNTPGRENGNPIGFHDDGIHPNVAGYAALGAYYAWSVVPDRVKLWGADDKLKHNPFVHFMSGCCPLEGQSPYAQSLFRSRIRWPRT